MSPPEIPPFDPAKARALIKLSKEAEQDVAKTRELLLAEATRVYPFKAKDGHRIHFRKLTYPEAVRIIYGKMPEYTREPNAEVVQVTPEISAQSFDIACEAIEVANIEQLTAKQIAQLGKPFVDEAIAFLMEISGLSPRAIDNLGFFRKLRRRLRVR